MERKYLIIILAIVVLVALVAFFFPNECGNWGTAVHPDAKYKDCTCIGIKHSPPLVGGGHITCFGIPTSYSCYYYEPGTEESPGAKKVDIPCE